MSSQYTPQYPYQQQPPANGQQGQPAFPGVQPGQQFAPQGQPPGYAPGTMAPEQELGEPMMDLTGQPEFDISWAPEGRYPIEIFDAVAGYSKAKAPMLTLQGRITEGPHADVTFYDYAIVKGGAKGAGPAVTKLKGLGINTETGGPVPLMQIAAALKGWRGFADLQIEERMSKDRTTGDLRPMTAMVDGKTVAAMQNKVWAYYRHAVAPQPQAPAAQPQFAPGQAVQQVVQQQPQYQPPQAPQFAPQPVPQQLPLQLQGQPQFAPQPPMQQAQPQFVQQAPQAQGAPPWQGQPHQAPAGGEAETKRGRGKKSDQQ